MPRLLPDLLTVLSLWCLMIASPAWAQRAYTPDYSVERYVFTYEVADDGTYTETSELQYRVLTVQGVSVVSKLTPSYIQGQEKVESLDAWTILSDGTRVPVEARNIRERAEDQAPGASQFRDERTRAIVFPKIQVGGAVGYRMRLKRFEADYPGQFTDSTVAYPDTPYEHLEVRYIVPAHRKLYIDQREFTGGLERSEAGFDHYVFRYRRLEAAAIESGAANPLHYADQLHVSTMPDMATLGRVAYPPYAEKAAVTDEIRDLAQRLTQGLTAERDKVAALYTWVAQNIRYVVVSLGNDGRFVPHPASQVLADRFGDCKDHTTLLQSLLSAVGISSSPALISTLPAYEFAKVGVNFPINHVINYVPSLDLYLDSTSRFSPVGTLSNGVAGKPVVLMALGRTARTPSNTARVNTARSDVDIRVQRDGTMVGTSRTIKTGGEEVSQRAGRFVRANRDDEENVREVLERFNETGSGAIRYPDPLVIDKPFSVDASFELDAPAAAPGRGAIRVPVGLAPGDFEEMASARPLSSARLPYVCGSRSVTERYRITFPDNVRVESVPRGARYEAAGIRYRSTYALKGRTVTSVREFVSDRSSPLCTSEDRARWREFHRVLQRDVRSLIFYR